MSSPQTATTIAPEIALGEGLDDFSTPSVADSAAGASFFEQHYRDLRWSTGQELITQSLESFVLMIADVMRNAPNSSTKLSDDAYAEARDVAVQAIEHRGEIARAVVVSNASSIIETILCRYVDNFLCYLTDLLELILVEVPGVLTSTESHISVNEVFQHEDLASLQNWIIEKKINSLSFGGLATIEEYYEKKFGLTLIPNSQSRAKIALAIAARNLLVHRRGVIDYRFVKTAGPSLGRVGRRVKITHLVWTELVPAILRAVKEIDRRAATRFGFQASLIVSSDDAAALQEKFLSRVAKEVIDWKTTSS